MAGWQFKQWSNSSVVPSYLARYDNVLVPLSLEAEFIEMQTITVESEIVNTYETDAISCAGYCQVTPAKKYYRSPTTVILNDFDWGANPEIIRVEATPREGFFFGWWEGDAWYYTEGQIVNPGADAPFVVKDNQQPKCLSDSDEQNRVTQRTIFIQTANNNKQATSPTVRAWFHPCVHCGEPSNYGAGGTVGELKGSTLLLHSDPQSGTGYHFAETHNGGNAGTDYALSVFIVLKCAGIVCKVPQRRDRQRNSIDALDAHAVG